MRSTDVDAAPPSRQEVKLLPDQDITCTEKGMVYLESTLLTIPDVPYMVDKLVGALFQISMLPGIKGSKKNTNAVCTVAYVLVGLDTDVKAQAIAGAVVDQMVGQLDSLKERAEKVAQVRLWEVANSMKVQMDSTASCLSEGMRATLQGMNENAAKLTEMAASYRDMLARTGPPHPPNGSAMMQEGRSLLLAPRLQAMEGVRARQVLIDISTDQDPGLPEEFATCSNVGLKEKLDDALSGCGDGVSSTRFKTRAVSRLMNGGILMELESDEAAGWFADSSIRWSFLARLHPDASIKTRSFHVVVQFVPLISKPDKDTCYESSLSYLARRPSLVGFRM